MALLASQDTRRAEVVDERDLAGIADLGHMEILARRYGVSDHATMLVSGRLRCVHVSTHYSLRDALDRITRARVLTRLQTTDAAFRAWGRAVPKIAVAAVNPHGGEGGILGREEILELAPAVADARALGIDAHGPLPADSVFTRAMRGGFDAVVAMFHDQGHIPVKVHGFEESVSVALVAPLTFCPSFCHWKVGVGEPDAVATSTTVVPAETVWLCGWSENVGAIGVPPDTAPLTVMAIASVATDLRNGPHARVVIPGIVVGLTGVVLGLLPLIKGSLLPLVVVTLVL